MSCIICVVSAGNSASPRTYCQCFIVYQQMVGWRGGHPLTILFRPHDLHLVLFDVESFDKNDTNACAQKHSAEREKKGGKADKKMKRSLFYPFQLHQIKLERLLPNLCRQQPSNGISARFLPCVMCFIFLFFSLNAGRRGAEKKDFYGSSDIKRQWNLTLSFSIRLPTVFQ